MDLSAEIEEAELRLIQMDVEDATRASLAFQKTPIGNVLSLLVLPASAFLAEESHQYFMRRRRMQRIGSINGELFEQFGRSVKKIRARLKLFDDTDAGPENLVEFMALVRRQSRLLFSHPSNRIIQLISGPFRPDLGAYFVGERLVATTHALLPTTGVTLELVNDVKPGNFADFNAFAFNFAKAMGAHFWLLADILGSIGLTVDLEPAPQNVDWTITRNDFVGARFYRHAESAVPGAKPQRIPVLTLCLGQVNSALCALPTALGERSNLLARVQFLTAYHAHNALSASGAPEWVTDASNEAVFSPTLRNVFAHYELRQAADLGARSANPLVAAVERISQRPWDDIMSLTRARLERLAEHLGHALTKTALRPTRALLGDHT